MCMGHESRMGLKVKVIGQGQGLRLWLGMNIG